MDLVGFDHCVIAVSDREASDAFYGDVLGAEIPPHDEWSARYRFGDWRLNVHGPGSLLEFVSYAGD